MYLKVTGRSALFARPEIRAERISYDFMTPSAAQGVLKAIYWKPQMCYVIHDIRSYREPSRETIKTNDSNFKPSMNQILNDTLTKTGGSALAISRSSLILRNVEYVINFSIELVEPKSKKNTLEKHYEIFTRRAKHGQYFQAPCLGAKEFTADVELLESAPESPLKGIRDYGIMFHHYDYSGRIPTPVFFHAVMENGIVKTEGETVMDLTDAGRQGWLLQELVQQYERKKDICNLPRFGFSEEKITFEAVINEQGTLIEFRPIQENDKGKPVQILMNVPEAVKNRSSNILPNFLWDVPGYAVGWPAKGKDCTKKFEAFRDRVKAVLLGDHEEYGANLLPEEAALLHFLQKKPELDLLLPYEKELEQSRKICFRLEGKDTYIHDNPVVQDKWSIYYGAHRDGIRGLCMVTGMEDIMAEIHPYITGVKGTKMNRAKLISIDRNNGKTFECYGASSCLSESTPIGECAAFMYAAMLNYYLARPEHRVIIGDTTYVFWSEYDTPQLLRKIKYLLSGFFEDFPEDRFVSEESFTILGLQPNAAGGIRLGVRCYEHFQDNACKEQLEAFMLRIQGDYINANKKPDWEYIHTWEDENKMDQANKTQGYLLGELFAVLDKIQKDAVPSTRRNRTSLVYKYLRIAKTSPARVMEQLVSKSFYHTKKKDYGLGRQRSGLLLQLEGFNPLYPERLSTEEQARFQIGYEVKTKELYTPKAKKESQKTKESEEQANA